MNIIEYLKRQHDEVRDELDRIIAEDDDKESRSLLDQMSKTLRLHMQIEEKMVYPAASQAFEGDDDEEETVLESYEEHEVAKRCLVALEGTAPTDRRFVIRAKVLKGILDKHMEEEESQLFPEIEDRLGQTGVDRLSAEVESKMPQLEAEAAPRRAERREVRTAKVRAAIRSRATRPTQTKRTRAGVRGAKTRAAQSRGGARTSRKRQ
jgi:iron-sulfur cluster repair protein YtfE (RIC family)